MITIEIDGFWCSQCKTNHPILHWHDKYDDYETSEKVKKKWKKSIYPRFFKNQKWEDVESIMLSNINSKPYQEMEETGKCVVCGCETHFINKHNKHYICSNECFYEDK